jgi:hypothetical protein
MTQIASSLLHSRTDKAGVFSSNHPIYARETLTATYSTDHSTTVAPPHCSSTNPNRRRRSRRALGTETLAAIAEDGDARGEHRDRDARNNGHTRSQRRHVCTRSRRPGILFSSGECFRSDLPAPSSPPPISMLFGYGVLVGMRRCLQPDWVD